MPTDLISAAVGSVVLLAVFNLDRYDEAERAARGVMSTGIVCTEEPVGVVNGSIAWAFAERLRYADRHPHDRNLDGEIDIRDLLAALALVSEVERTLGETYELPVMPDPWPTEWMPGGSAPRWPR